jgi:hypothetical protein
MMLRSAAVVVAVLTLFGPNILAAIRGLDLKRRASVNKDDAHTVIEIARRLQVTGNSQGVSLCQKLLEVLLAVEAPGKK